MQNHMCGKISLLIGLPMYANARAHTCPFHQLVHTCALLYSLHPQQGLPSMPEQAPMLNPTQQVAMPQGMTPP
eukprot:scaffold214673_cov22-Tisochrysis_lutea.AAC.2